MLVLTGQSAFATGALVPSLLGGLTAVLVLPLLIFATGPVSGAHLNPTITIATFFARLATLPRCILYVAFQILGGTLAGLLLRASFDTRSVRLQIIYPKAQKLVLTHLYSLSYPVVTWILP